ncbi:MAG: glycoside hydrolase family 5 protein [Lentisphaerae bacterium]|nr:glycoside hydrolase family 5 protein [Lentisphaerota bacterium]
MKLTKVMMMLLAIGTLAAAQEVYRCRFSAEELAEWQLGKQARGVELDGDPALEVRIPAGQTATYFVGRPFPIEQYRGKWLNMTCKIRFENVTQPPDSWNGTKFMLIYKKGDGATSWIHPAGQYGSSDWQLVSRFFQVDENASKGLFQLGLQDCSGAIWFKDMAITLIDRDNIFPRLTPEDYRIEYSEQVRNEPLRRGMMSPHFGPNTLEKDLPVLASWGANIVRWQMSRNWHKRNDNQDLPEYFRWIDEKIAQAKQGLDRCHELGLRVILDLHVPPGGRNLDGRMNMFDNREYADAFVEVWRRFATAVKGHPALYGYDLINEPQQIGVAFAVDYLSLQYEAAQVVRAIDPQTPIIIESNEWDSATAFSYLSPIPMKDVIYQAHMYFPSEFTHQGVGNRKVGLKYPDPKRNWDKEALRRHLQPVRDFQLKHGARILIGEFSAPRYAEGAERYLADCIAIFEEYGWDWTYHAFRESPIWNVEMTGGVEKAVPATEDTPRKRVLLEGFKKNQR